MGAFPTATHALARGQETLPSPLVSGTSGVASIVHAVPFHRSAIGWWSSAPSIIPPTAMQVAALGQDTEDMPSSIEELGAGSDWIDQLLPFHRSARLVRSATPTAKHAVADGHATPLRALSLNLPPPVLGVCWTSHFLPFQRKTSARWLVVSPTAVHCRDDLHEIPRSLKLRPTCRAAQCVPFQLRTIALPSKTSKVPPTATHPLRTGQDTDHNWSGPAVTAWAGCDLTGAAVAGNARPETAAAAKAVPMSAAKRRSRIEGMTTCWPDAMRASKGSRPQLGTAPH